MTWEKRIRLINQKNYYYEKDRRRFETACQESTKSKLDIVSF